MKKATKRPKSKAASKPASVRSKTRSKPAGAKSKRTKATKPKRPVTSGKSVIPKAATLKEVAKDAAVAAGLAAIGTALAALKPDQTASEVVEKDTDRKGDKTPKP